jgi:hypothetical protein
MSITKTGAMLKKCKNPECNNEMHSRVKNCQSCGTQQYHSTKRKQKILGKIPRRKNSKKARKIKYLEDNFVPATDRIQNDKITVQDALQSIELKKLLLQHGTQRKVGQWPSKFRKEFLQTLFEYGSSVSGITIRKVLDDLGRMRKEVWDGSHRLWTLYMFYTNEYAFPPDSCLEINGTIYNVGNIYFKELPEALKRAFLGAQIPVSYLSETISLKELAILFKRLQNGKKLRNIEIIMVSHDLNAKYLQRFKDHNLFADIIVDTVRGKYNISDLHSFNLAAITLYSCHYKKKFDPRGMIEFYLSNNIDENSQECKMADRVCDILHGILKEFEEKLSKKDLPDYDYRVLLHAIIRILDDDYNINCSHYHSIFQVFVEDTQNRKNRSSNNQILKDIDSLKNEIIQRVSITKNQQMHRQYLFSSY